MADLTKHHKSGIIRPELKGLKNASIQKEKLSVDAKERQGLQIPVLQDGKAGDLRSIVLQEEVQRPSLSFHAIKVIPVINDNVRNLCTRPYPNHPKGCPNFNHKKGCPPNCPKFFDTFYQSKNFYALYAEFEIGVHAAQLKAKYPTWTDRQAYCCLYWQPRMRKFLRRKAQEWMTNFVNTYTDFVDLYGAAKYTECPEALGVNVTRTMEKAGVILEWPPKKITRMIYLFGVSRA